MIRAAIVALILAFACVASAESDLLKTARNTFEYGNYTESVKLAENLLASHQLSEERDLIEAYRIAGLSNFYLNRPEAARRHFVALLSVDPDYSMDPFLVPPAAVAFFDGVKRDNEALLKPIRERRKAMAEQERLADEARRKLIEENLMRQLEPERPVLVQRVEVHSNVTNFVPFGAGQFQENRNGAGALFAATQIAGLGTAAFSFAKIESLRDENGKFAHADIGSAENFAKAKWIGLGVFAASAIGGVIDSVLHYEPQTTSIEALRQPAARVPTGVLPTVPSAPKPAQPPPDGTPPPAAPTPDSKPHSSLQLLPFASPDSLGVGLAATF